MSWANEQSDERGRSAELDPASKDGATALLERGLHLEYLTLGWNVIGAGVVIAAAIAAGSTALAGLGLDSLIEIFASLVVIWQLNGVDRQCGRRAIQLIGGSFFVLAAYVLVQALSALLTGARAHPSPLGIAWLASTLVAMLLLAWGKHITGKQLGNAVLMTEARVTLIDGLLAAAVLLGLILNAAVGWWWADPLAGLVITYYGLREGWAAWHGEAT
jgi:divalent metal cation (Fe/Co/Zn/Cd) transporter